MDELTEKQRKELVKHLWDTGFLIQSKPFLKLKTEEERYERVKSLINDGYRIQLWGKKFDIINIQGRCISQGLIDELTEVYNYLKPVTKKQEEDKEEK